MSEVPAPEVVLLHALGLVGSSYDPLVASVPGWQVLAPDLRGHGSASSTRPVDLESMAADVVDLLASFDRPVHLVGHSLGGAVAGLVADRAPDLLHSLVVVATPPRGVEAFADRAAAAERDGMAAQVDVTLGRWFGGAPADTTVVEAAASLERMSVAAWCAAWRSFATFEGWRQLRLAPSLAVRTLCVSYADDLSTPPPAVAEVAASQPGARHVTVEHGGHLGLLEDPRPLASILVTHWHTPATADAGKDHR